MVRLLTALLFPLLVLLAIVAPVVIPWLFGPAWGPAIVPTQVLAIGGAATIVIDAVGAALMAGGRALALLGFGLGHFACYAAAVWVTAPFGLTAVAMSAAVVHSAFVVVAYFLMCWGVKERALHRIWQDVAPAGVSCVALAAAGVPASIGISAVDPPAVVYLLVVTLAAGPAYVTAMRVGFPETWSLVSGTIRRLLPRWRPRRRNVGVEVTPVSAAAETESRTLVPARPPGTERA